MTQEEFGHLQTGDKIESRDGRLFVVTAHFGDRVTAVASIDMTNPSEWKLVRDDAEKMLLSFGELPGVYEVRRVK